MNVKVSNICAHFLGIKKFSDFSFHLTISQYLCFRFRQKLQAMISRVSCWVRTSGLKVIRKSLFLPPLQPRTSSAPPLVTQPMLQLRPNWSELRSMDYYHQIFCRFRKCKRKVPPPSPFSTQKSPFTPPKDKKNLPLGGVKGDF